MKEFKIENNTNGIIDGDVAKKLAERVASSGGISLSARVDGVDVFALFDRQNNSVQIGIPSGPMYNAASFTGLNPIKRK